jgi:hypothetical protein
MLDRCKAVAKRAGLDPAKFDLKTFRSTYATRMLRQGFDVRTVQHWMGHKSLETTMRYLVPAADVHGKFDQVKIPGLQNNGGADRKSPRREMALSRRGRPAKSVAGEAPGFMAAESDIWSSSSAPRIGSALADCVVPFSRNNLEYRWHIRGATNEPRHRAHTTSGVASQQKEAGMARPTHPQST